MHIALMSQIWEDKIGMDAPSFCAARKIYVNCLKRILIISSPPPLPLQEPDLGALLLHLQIGLA